MKFIKRIVYFLSVFFIIINIVAAFHAYKFTHFIEGNGQLTQSPKKLSGLEKIKALVFGVSNYKPENDTYPTNPYSTIDLLTKDGVLKVWETKVDSSKGAVIVLHGYRGQKSSMIDRAEYFNSIGYSTLILDFRGCGDSFGYQTTIGFHEANDVKATFDYAKTKFNNIFIFGSSMGSVAAMKCISDFKIKPQGLLIECPFGSMLQTTYARFNNMGVPTFPMAELLVLWGGIENDFWAFDHNPIEYAKNISCPTLLLYGLNDDKVSREEIDLIFNNIKGQKQLELIPNTGHENYLKSKPIQWRTVIAKFLSRNIEVYRI
jgi:alpha-beta hydrolase superfamily lysophospholipase